MNWTPLVAALGVTAATLTAQQPANPVGPDAMGHLLGDPMTMQEMMAPVMRTLLYTPQHLLARKEAIGLTPDQVARLTALEQVTKAARDAAAAEAGTHVEAMAQAADVATPDTTRLKEHFEAAHAAMGRAQWRALASAVQAKALLNEGQRTKVSAWADSIEAWMEQHRRMMRPHESP